MAGSSFPAKAGSRVTSTPRRGLSAGRQVGRKAARGVPGQDGGSGGEQAAYATDPRVPLDPAKITDEVVSVLTGAGVRVAPIRIVRRLDFVNGLPAGQAAIEWQRSGKAALETSRL